MLERRYQMVIPDLGRVAQTGYCVLRDADGGAPVRLRSNTTDLLQIAIKRWKDDCRMGRLLTDQILLCVIPFEFSSETREKETINLFFEHGQGQAVDVSMTSYWHEGELVPQSSERYNSEYLNIFGRVLESLQYAKICRVDYGKEVVHLAALESFI